MLTVEEVTERLRQAAHAVQEAGLSEDLREIGFERALEALGLGASAPVAAAATSGGLQRVGVPEASVPTVEASNDDSSLATIARRFELSQDSIDRIYEVEEGTVRLAIKRSMLPAPDRKAAAMRHVSLLVVAGRQAAGKEEQTPLAAVREECQALNVLDPPNFASEIGKLDFRLQGPRNDRTAKANRHHFEEAADLIREILGDGAS